MSIELSTLRNGISKEFDTSVWTIIVDVLLDFKVIYIANPGDMCPAPDPRAYGTSVDAYLLYKDSGFVDAKDIGFDDYSRDVEAYLSFHPAGGISIPAHKLTSNHGWIVRSFEVASFLLALEHDLDDILAVLENTPEAKIAFVDLHRFLYKAHLDGGFVVW